MMRIGNIFKRRVVGKFIETYGSRIPEAKSLTDIGDTVYAHLVSEEELSYMMERPKLFTWARAVNFEGRSLPLSEPRPFPSTVPELPDEVAEYIETDIHNYEYVQAERKAEREELYCAIKRCSTLKALVAQEPLLFDIISAVIVDDDRKLKPKRIGADEKAIAVFQDEGMCSQAFLEYMTRDMAKCAANSKQE